MSELEYHSVAFGAHKNTVNLLHYFLIAAIKYLTKGTWEGRKEEREGGREGNSRNIKLLSEN